MSTAARAGSARGFEAAIDDIGAKGAVALRETKASFDEVVSDVTEKGREARDAVANAVLHSVKVRPYTTLAIAGLIGFLYGAMRRR